MEASNQVAIVGYAQSPVTRHADQTLGGLTVETARRAIEDAGLTVAEVDGFVTASLFPIRRVPTRRRTVSASSRPTGWPNASGSIPTTPPDSRDSARFPARCRWRSTP